MDDCSSLLLLILLGIAGTVGLLRAGRRDRELVRRLDALITELRDLHDENANLTRRLDALEAGAPVEPAEAAEVAKPTVEAPEPRAAEAVTPPAAMVTQEAFAENVPAPEERLPAAEPAAPGPPSPPLPPGPSFDIEWEQWLGVRGAAVVGGVLLALAALFFLRYAFEQGFFPPVVRVTLGFLAGAGCLGSSQFLRRRDYATTADALAGAGVVILYAATWAGAVLYELLPYGVAFALMALVTAVCGLLAWRHGSQVIALLGLLGGFATPLLLSSSRDDPLGLFGYVLLLDAGLLWLAHRRRWPALALLALLGTVFYQGLWIFLRMGPNRFGLGLGVVAVFAVFFAFAGRRREPEEGEETPGLWRLSRLSSVLLPFVFALYFAFQVEAELDLLPLAALLLLLSLAAEWVGREQGMALLGTGAATADLGVVFAWWARGGFASESSAELAATAVALALAFHLFTEWDRRRGREASSWSAPVAAGGFLFLLALGPALVRGATLLQSEPTAAPALLPWLVGWVLLAALLTRQAEAPGREPLRLAAAVGVAAGFALFHTSFKHTVGGTEEGLLAAPRFFGLALAGAAVFHGLALIPRSERLSQARRFADFASAAYPLVLLVFLVAEAAEPLPSYLGPGLYLTVSLLLAVLAALAAFLRPAGGLYFAAFALLAVQHALWSLWVPTSATPGATAGVGLMGFSLAVLAFTAGPFAAGRRFAAEPWAWWTAALAGPAWFLPLKRLWELRFGDGAIGLLPLALGALALAAALTARRWLPAADPARRRAVVWLAGVALSFVAVAIPLQLEKEWITLGWALQALAVLALWKRLDHPGLKYLALLLAAAVTVRLLINPEILRYYPRSPRPVFNWLMYTYLVPAAALLGSARLLRPLEVGRQRPAEAGLYRLGRPVGAIGCAVAAILVTFAWINLTIFDAFSTGAAVDLSLQRLPARDLTLSLAWILYALLLLAVGFGRDMAGLRWTGLAFLCLTLGKLFLYDLGELTGLYRVGSFVGLAISLLLVSLAYQRFIRLPPAAENPPQGGGEG